MSTITFEQMPSLMSQMAHDMKEIKAFIATQHKKKAVVPDNYLTRSQVAERYHITLPTLHSWTLEGKVQAYRIGRRVLYKEQELDSFLAVVRTSIKK